MTSSEIKMDDRVVVQGEMVGKVVYVREDGWIGVRIEGEKRVDEWQACQLRVVGPVEYYAILIK